MKKPYQFLHSVTKGQYRYLSLLLIFTSSFVLLNLIQPIIFAFVIDNVINLEPINNSFLSFIAQLLGGVTFIRSNLWTAALLIVLLALLSAVIVFIRVRLNGIISENVAFNLKNKVFDHLMHLPYEYFNNQASGDLIQRATSDIDTVRRVFAGQISEFIYAISIVVISFIIMINKNLKLALIASVLLPIIFIFAIVFFIKVQKDFLNYEEAESNLTNSISENLQATRLIKAYNRESYENEKFKKINANLSKAGKTMIDSLSMYWGVSDFFCFSSILLVIINSVIMIINNTLTIGDAFIFISYTSMMVWPLRHMGRIIADIGRVNVALRRIYEIVENELEDLESGEVISISGDIKIKDLKFKYAENDTYILNGVNMDIKAGETVAILGPTGSGKSSLIHLLMGLYPYSEGTIKLNGVNLKDISKGHLRKNVAIILQEPFLFSKSIKDNIMISSFKENLKDFDNAAYISNVEDFIKNFDLGYETVVGERGTTLSGGQKQRVAIARSIINDYPIIIFDDSLSAVDTETDASIRAKLKELKKDTTKIIITQRISTCEDADKVFVIEDGVITQSGTHNQLINEEGLYKRVYVVQNQEIGDDVNEKQ